MAANAWEFYNSFKEYMGDGTIDMDDNAGTFTVALVTSAYTFAATHTQRSDFSANEVSGSGYATYSLTVTWVESAGTVTWDSDDATFTASGGSITARRAIIYDDSTTTPVDALVCSSLLDNTPADVSVTDGNTLTVAMAGTGIFTLS